MPTPANDLDTLAALRQQWLQSKPVARVVLVFLVLTSVAAGVSAILQLARTLFPARRIIVDARTSSNSVKVLEPLRLDVSIVLEASDATARELKANVTVSQWAETEATPKMQAATPSSPLVRVKPDPVILAPLGPNQNRIDTAFSLVPLKEGRYVAEVSVQAKVGNRAKVTRASVAFEVTGAQPIDFLQTPLEEYGYFVVRDGTIPLPLKSAANYPLIRIIHPEEVAATNLVNGTLWLRVDYSGGCGGETFFVYRSVVPVLDFSDAKEFDMGDAKIYSGALVSALLRTDLEGEEFDLVNCFGFNQVIVPIGRGFYLLRFTEEMPGRLIVKKVQAECDRLSMSYVAGPEPNLMGEAISWRVNQSDLDLSTSEWSSADGRQYLMELKIKDKMFIYYSVAGFGSHDVWSDFPVVVYNSEERESFVRIDLSDGEQPVVIERCWGKTT